MAAPGDAYADYGGGRAENLSPGSRAYGYRSRDYDRGPRDDFRRPQGWSPDRSPGPTAGWTGALYSAADYIAAPADGPSDDLADDATDVMYTDLPLPNSPVSLQLLAKLIGQARPGSVIRLLDPEGRCIATVTAPGGPQKPGALEDPEARQRGARKPEDDAAVPGSAAPGAAPGQQEGEVSDAFAEAEAAHFMGQRQHPAGPPEISGPLTRWPPKLRPGPEEPPPSLPSVEPGTVPGTSTRHLSAMSHEAAPEGLWFSWITYLPVNARQALMAELLASVRAIAAGNAPLSTGEELITGWRATALIYADPALLQALMFPDDLALIGPVPEPTSP